MKNNIFFRIVTFYSISSIFLQSLLPFFSVFPRPAIAQDITPTATITEAPTSTPEPTVEPTVVPTVEPTIDPTPTITIEPTIAPTVAPTVAPTGEILDGISTSITPTSVPSQWTFENVELNKKYVSPQNSGVKLTFTKLPTPSGNIKIAEVTLTAEQIKQTGSLSDKAYDITSDMKDGDFTYNLSLPIPEASKGKEISVKFAETVDELVKISEVSPETIQKNESDVTVRSLNHFTVFVITGVNPPSASNIIDDGDVSFSTNTSWNSYASGINGDHHYIANTVGNWARWTFTDEQLPVAGQEYTISTHWVTWDDHVANATYKLYNNLGVLVATLGIVDQNKDSVGATVPNGTLSGWKTFTGNFTLQNNYYIELESDGSNSRNIVADAV